MSVKSSRGPAYEYIKEGIGRRTGFPHDPEVHNDYIAILYINHRVNKSKVIVNEFSLVCMVNVTLHTCILLRTQATPFC